MKLGRQLDAIDDCGRRTTGQSSGQGSLESYQRTKSSKSAISRPTQLGHIGQPLDFWQLKLLKFFSSQATSLCWSSFAVGLLVQLLS